MAKIQVLSEHLTNMIAAGEVVERPAGIVKECVENSIDAGAKVIDIEAFQGGIERLVITDDGSGMDPQDAHMAFMRHATSKLSSEEGLFNIQTMGFRGEALPSIASVAHVRLETNDGNQGTMIEYDYGQLVNEESGHFPKGTSIAIRRVFLMNLVSLPIWSIRWHCPIQRSDSRCHMMGESFFKRPATAVCRRSCIRCMAGKWPKKRSNFTDKTMILRLQATLYSPRSIVPPNILCLLR